MKKWYQQTDMMLGVSVVAVVAMMIIPIPTFLLDMLMGISIMVGLITIITVMYSKGNADLSVFPSLLLVTTVFRLALNVSSTRLILLDGPAFDGQLIKAFGNFVVGGNYIIGFIIFLILIFVQMLVITKGANRIGEVAARFALDALPGKQMSIDNDLNAGILSEEEAHARREELRREVDFYGQMDGATKFVQGDVRVGLIITAINIVGGLLVGTLQQGLDISSAAKLFTLLTIGDGLVAQVPSLLITTATALVVTRAGARENLGEELSKQFFMDAKILWITAGTLGFASLIPGFPKLSLWLVSGFLAFLAYTLGQTQEEEKLGKKDAEEAKKPKSPDQFLEELNVDPLQVEVGYNLLSLVDPAQGGTLIDRITNLRQKLAKEYGMIIPPIRIKDNMDLDTNEYAVLVGGIEVARETIYPEKLVALDSGNLTGKVEGEPYKDPSFNVNGVLINPDQKAEAEAAGYMVIAPGDIIVTQLGEILRNYVTEIMGREEVKLLLDKVKERHPAVVEEVLSKGSVSLVQHVLHRLLKEGVSVRNMVSILETIADNIDKTKEPVLLAEFVRRRLGRQIVGSYLQNGTLDVVQLDPEVEAELRAAVTFDEREGLLFTMDPHRQVAIRDAFIQAYSEAQQKGMIPVFLTSAEIRAGIYMMLERELKPRTFAVLAYEELPGDVQVNVVGHVILQETGVGA